MQPPDAPYRSYLLRLWPAGQGAQRRWRASLENPVTGERLGFGTLERLVAFLHDQCDAEAEAGRGGAIDPPAT